MQFSLPWSQQPAIGLCLEPAESTFHLPHQPHSPALDRQVLPDVSKQAAQRPVDTLQLLTSRIGLRT